MRTVIIGAGAIGATVAARLAAASEDVALVDPWVEHVEAISAHGLDLTGALGELRVAVPAVTPDRIAELGPADVVLIATKSYDTAASAELGRAILADDGVIVSMQNGMNDETIAAVAGKDRTLGCVVNIGGRLLGPGRVECSGVLMPGFEVGTISGASHPGAPAVAELLSHVTPSVPTDVLLGRRWAKLIHNSMFNALAGFTGVGNPPLAGVAGCRVSVAIAAEAVQVARATGVEVTSILGVAADDYVRAARGEGEEAVFQKLVEGASALPADVRPSLLQDIDRGRRTEIDELNGAVIERGVAAGVATPANSLIVAELARMVREGRSPAWENIAVFDRLWQEGGSSGTAPIAAE